MKTFKMRPHPRPRTSQQHRIPMGSFRSICVLIIFIILTGMLTIILESGRLRPRKHHVPQAFAIEGFKDRHGLEKGGLREEGAPARQNNEGNSDGYGGLEEKEHVNEQEGLFVGNGRQAYSGHMNEEKAVSVDNRREQGSAHLDQEQVPSVSIGMQRAIEAGVKSKGEDDQTPPPGNDDGVENLMERYGGVPEYDAAKDFVYFFQQKGTGIVSVRERFLIPPFGDSTSQNGI